MEDVQGGKLINQEATFRGVILSHAVGMTKNEFPQFVFKFRAKEIWDEDEHIWAEWVDQEEADLTAYLCLFGKNNEETANCKQVKKALGWAGDSFQSLDNLDISEAQVQIRTKWNEWNGETKIDVAWLDEADAVPGGTVRKLTPDEVKSLDSKFAKFLKGKTTPTKAPAKGGSKSAPAKPKAGPKASPKKPAAKPKAAPKAAPKADEPEGKCTKDEAWNTCVDMKRSDVTDDAQAKIWLASVAEVMGDRAEDDLTEQDWFVIREKVLDDTGVF